MSKIRPWGAPLYPFVYKGFRGARKHLTVTTIIWYTMYIMEKR